MRGREREGRGGKGSGGDERGEEEFTKGKRRKGCLYLTSFLMVEVLTPSMAATWISSLLV